jgi:hypothetical protein
MIVSTSVRFSIELLIQIFNPQKCDQIESFSTHLHCVWIPLHTSSRFLSQGTDFVDILLLHPCTTTEENLETSLDGFQWHRRNWVAIPQLHLNIVKRKLEGWFDILKNMHFQVAFSRFFTKASTAQASEYFYLCLLKLYAPSTDFHSPMYASRSTVLQSK